MSGQGPLIATAATGAVLAGLAAVVLSFIRYTAPTPEKVADEVEAVVRRTGLRGLFARRLAPIEATGVALTAAMVMVVVAIVIFGVMAILATRTSLWVVDAAGADWGSRNAGPLSIMVLEWVTAFGGTNVAVTITAIAALWAWLSTGHRGPPLFLITVLVGEALVFNCVKLLTERGRPPVTPLTGWAGSSFPSGHSATAAAVFAALALLLSRGRSRPVAIALGAGAAAITGMIAASRVLLGVHWVTDAVAGVALGFLWFVASALAFGGRRLRLAPLHAEPEPTHRSKSRRRPMTERDPYPTDEQVRSRADSLEAEPGNQSANVESQARALLEESEERVADRAARVPGDRRAIRRDSDEGVVP